MNVRDRLESAEFYNRRYGTFTTKLIWPIVVFIVILAVFLCFTKKEITVKSIGQIVPKTTLTTIQSPSNAAIIENNLKENKVVHSGETLLVFNNQETSINQDNNQQKYNRNLNRLQLLKTYQQSVEQGKSFFQTNDEYGYADQFSDYQSQLNDLDLSNQESIDQINQSDIEQTEKNKKIDQTNQSTNQKKTSLKSKALASIHQEVQSLNDSGIDLKTNQDLLNNTANSSMVKAPITGILHLKSASSKSQYLASGTEVAEIYPELKEKPSLLIQFAVPANQLNELKLNQKIKFQANQNGPKPLLLDGQINQIDEAPTETQQGSVYRVTAQLSLKKIDYDQIRYGLEGKVSVITGKKTWMNYLKDSIFK